jgi:putative MATE family efflux protein
MLRRLLGDKPFYQKLVSLALPIVIQQGVMASLNAIDVLMIGQLGETSLAAVGLSNQVFFVLWLTLFGIGSGAAVFGAQYWGRRDVTNIRKVLGISLMMGLVTSALFSILAIFFPHVALGIYSKDSAVVAVGSPYLRVVGMCYLVTSVTSTYSLVLRSTENVRLPMIVSVLALSFKTVLAYLLIFGRMGLPEMGVMGAAVSTVIARYLECALLLIGVYRRPSPLAARLRDMLSFDWAFLKRFLRTSMPVVWGEFGWALGGSVYIMIYARISTSSVAAINITNTVEGLSVILLIGLASACSIMIGNMIGAGDEDSVSIYATRFLIMAAVGGVLVGGAIFAASGKIVTLYQVSPETQGYAQRILMVAGVMLWLKACNMTAIVGILRSGGDTQFAFYADTGSVWLVGIPLAYLGAFVLHLPVYGVYLMILLGDELVKFAASMWRVFSGRWINNVVETG